MRRVVTALAVVAVVAAWPGVAAADPPTVSITGGPAGPTNDATPTFTFASDDALAALTCRLDGPSGATGTELPCASRDELGPLAEGDYIFVVHATDPVNGVGEATRVFTADLTPPPAPTLAGTPDGFTFTGEPAASFACRLDGPAGQAAEAPCTSPQTYPGLAPGAYTFFVRAVDAAGNAGAAASLAFTVAPPPVVTPPPTPLQLPASPVPRLHATVVARPGLAEVRVRLPGGRSFVLLTTDRALPVGTLVDTRRGGVQLLSAAARGTKPERATLDGAVFRVTQPGTATVLTLKPSGCRAARLSGEGHGAFAVRGRYSMTTVRSSRWVVQDSCAGTLTRSLRGVVQVRDTVRHRTLLLRAGRSYLAHSRD